MFQKNIGIPVSSYPPHLFHWRCRADSQASEFPPEKPSVDHVLRLAVQQHGEQQLCPPIRDAPQKMFSNNQRTLCNRNAPFVMHFRPSRSGSCILKDYLYVSWLACFLCYLVNIYSKNSKNVWPRRSISSKPSPINGVSTMGKEEDRLSKA